MIILPDAKSRLHENGAKGEREYFTVVRARIDGFIAQHFRLRGALALHRHAMGLDILRAPMNVVLSPVLVLIRILAALCAGLGLNAFAGWLRGRRILLRTAVAAQVEAAVVSDLLGIMLPQNGARDSVELSQIILAAPQFRGGFRAKADVASVRTSAARVADAITEYTSVRSAVADITNALIALVIGGLVFHSVTPGMISMAPALANALALETAVANFPLGKSAGAMWYGVFSASASPWLVAVVVAALLFVGSVISAFSGVLADPLQARLGIHRRRLLQFVDAVEDELIGAGTIGYTAHEHFYARFVDVWDALVSAFRIFRS
ncbi:DUF6635 family protein [Sulfitobacter guttiformis]|uniref:Uncharacterized protein n=1 Tax=Sulfitobacter guttiformis TaxID=74349 RepID=A0A420DPR1_9RHOB|nr:DUF6635 family protein [Sulfitobacter guttiformis]KIN73504.1 hypothetical protein Z949_2694 [Sulfitobacter guttiformis KCTC 32187]RKE96159.1 hypothetical protein C8N30_0712 [Sulfitobacter guttiformis]